MSGKGKTNPNKKLANKQKEIPKLVTKTKSIDSPETPPKECPLSFPLLKTVDNARTLPRYSAILNRPDEEGVGMEDLDGLQLELEALLSAVVVRTRVLQEEIRILSDEEEKRDKTKQHHHAIKKSNPVGRPSLKRFKNGAEKATKKFRDASKSDAKPAAIGSPIKFTKVKSVSLVSNPLNQNLNLPEPDAFESRMEGRKVVTPKNDTPNKFWASVEPYFAEITPDDIRLLHEQIAEQQDEHDEHSRVPPLGKHYTQRWAMEDLSEEQAAAAAAAAGSQGKRKRNASESSPGIVGKKDKCSESPTMNAGPLAQRLVSCLMEENVVPDKKIGTEKVVLENVSPTKQPPAVLRSFSMNFERRVRKELEECGIVDPPDAAKDDEDDEIATEIKRCQKELKLVQAMNLRQLKRVLAKAEQEVKRQELEKRLAVVDAEICDAYKKIQMTKSKKKPPNKKDREQAMEALAERERITNQFALI